MAVQIQVYVSLNGMRDLCGLRPGKKVFARFDKSIVCNICALVSEHLIQDVTDGVITLALPDMPIPLLGGAGDVV